MLKYVLLLGLLATPPPLNAQSRTSKLSREITSMMHQELKNVEAIDLLNFLKDKYRSPADQEILQEMSNNFLRSFPKLSITKRDFSIKIGERGKAAEIDTSEIAWGRIRINGKALEESDLFSFKNYLELLSKNRKNKKKELLDHLLLKNEASFLPSSATALGFMAFTFYQVSSSKSKQVSLNLLAPHPEQGPIQSFKCNKDNSIDMSYKRGLVKIIHGKGRVERVDTYKRGKRIKSLFYSNKPAGFFRETTNQTQFYRKCLMSPCRSKGPCHISSKCLENKAFLEKIRTANFVPSRIVDTAQFGSSDQKSNILNLKDVLTRTGLTNFKIYTSAVKCCTGHTAIYKGDCEKIISADIIRNSKTHSRGIKGEGSRTLKD